jgi:hypothetical protein
MCAESTRWVVGFGPGNQEFFCRFIRACDSQQFSVCLGRCLAAELGQGAAALEEHASRATDGFTPLLARCKLSAKFVGVLAFAPNWGANPEALAALE